MKCVICHDDDIQAKDVREEFNFGDDIIYVTLLTLVCQTCGERYYSRRAMQFLEETESKLRAGQAQLQEVGKVFQLA